MQLTRYTDYGFRLLTYLALLPEGERVSINDISEIYAISRNNVNKVVHQLGKAGVIDTKQGKGGGICLKMSPENVNVGDIVLLLENTIRLVDCQSPPCKIAGMCVLKNVFEEATDAFLATLKKYTLADLLSSKKHQQQLIQILNIEGP